MTLSHSKICFKCNYKKELSLFYVHKMMKDGHLNKCIDCTKKDALKVRKNNLEYYKKYDRERGGLDHRIKARKEYALKNKNKILRAQKKWNSINTLKRVAHGKVRYAILTKKLIKEVCSVCGSKKSEAHHEDYNKPLDVIWFCDLHHKKRHKEINEIKRKKDV